MTLVIPDGHCRNNPESTLELPMLFAPAGGLRTKERT
jgi:hypothetical protein